MNLPETWSPSYVRSWRIWRIDHPTGLLKSSATSDFWHVNMPAARCDITWRQQQEPHDSPAYPCWCGYNSLKPEVLAKPALWHSIVWSAESVIMMGVAGWVENWGVVDEYELGYRSQHSRIVSLIDFDMAWMRQNYYPFLDYGDAWLGMKLAGYKIRLDQIAKRYELPVVAYDG